MVASSKKYHIASLCAILALGLTGCGSLSSTEASTTTAPTPTNDESTTPLEEIVFLYEAYLADLSITELGSKGKHVEIDDLVEAWENATGEVCLADMGFSEEFESESVHCNEETVLLVFSSTTSVKRHLDYADKRYRDSYGPRSQLVGQNWIANVDEALIPALHKELGGVKVKLGY